MVRSIALSLAFVASPVFADTLQVETADGTVAVPSNPQSVLVYDIAALDTLDALGVEVDGVVNKLFVDYVADTADTAEGAEVVGTLFEPDFETVAKIGPDLIIAGGRSSKVVPDLAKLAPTVNMTMGQDVYGTGLARLATYGEIFGKTEEADALAAEVEAKLTAAKAAVEGAGDALIVLTNGPKVSAYGAEGRFGWLHQTLGLPLAVEDVEKATHGEAVSFEFISEADPDILIVVDRLAAIGREGERAEATLDNPLVTETKAWKSGKVIYLDAAEIYIAGGGVQSMMTILDQITGALTSS